MALRQLYRASAWTLFFLFFGVWWLADMVVGGTPAGHAVVTVLADFSNALQLAWLYQLNADLGRHCGFRSSGTENRFAAMLVALLVILVFIPSGQAAETWTAWFAFIALFFPLLYLTSAHVAQKLVACEAAALGHQRSRGGATMMFMFIAIGIWFLQPRIKRLLVEAAHR